MAQAFHPTTWKVEAEDLSEFEDARAAQKGKEVDREGKRRVGHKGGRKRERTGQQKKRHPDGQCQEAGELLMASEGFPEPP